MSEESFDFLYFLSWDVQSLKPNGLETQMGQEGLQECKHVLIAGQFISVAYDSSTERPIARARLFEQV